MIPFMIIKVRGSKIDHWVKAVAAKPDDLNLIPWTHTVEGENQFPKVAL